MCENLARIGPFLSSINTEKGLKYGYNSFNYNYNVILGRVSISVNKKQKWVKI